MMVASSCEAELDLLLWIGWLLRDNFDICLLLVDTGMEYLDPSEFQVHVSGLETY